MFKPGTEGGPKIIELTGPAAAHGALTLGRLPATSFLFLPTCVGLTTRSRHLASAWGREGSRGSCSGESDALLVLL